MQHGEGEEERYGQRLKALRKAKGLSLSELGEMAGYSKGHLSLVERDQSVGSPRFWRAIAQALEEPIGPGAEVTGVPVVGFIEADGTVVSEYLSSLARGADVEPPDDVPCLDLCQCYNHVALRLRDPVVVTYASGRSWRFVQHALAEVGAAAHPGDAIFVADGDVLRMRLVDEAAGKMWSFPLPGDAGAPVEYTGQAVAVIRGSLNTPPLSGFDSLASRTSVEK